MLRRPRGIPYIGCTCCGPPWPLYVRQQFIFWDRPIDGAVYTPPLVWRLKGYSDSGQEEDEVRGRCPQCNKRVHLIFPNSYKDFLEAGDDLRSEKEVSEEEQREAVHNQAHPKTYRHVFALGSDEDGTQFHYSVAEILTPNVRVIPSYERKQAKNKPVWVEDIPSAGGEKKLLVNSLEKERFVKIILSPSVERENIILPDWNPDAPNERFIEWTEAIQAQLPFPYRNWSPAIDPASYAKKPGGKSA